MSEIFFIAWGFWAFFAGTAAASGHWCLMLMFGLFGAVSLFGGIFINENNADKKRFWTGDHKLMWRQ